MIQCWLQWLLLLFSCLGAVKPVFAWSEGGHHVIALIAFDRLSPGQQQKLLELIKSHPRYSEDFKPPKSMIGSAEINRWIVGRVAYWPDVARQVPEFDRPTWHYELGPTTTLGDVNKLKVHARPGSLPKDAGLFTQSLYISQAIQLCSNTLQDQSRPGSERAIALCGLGHLVGDAHQPCHAGSLYVEGVFPEGDRGANSIPTKQDRNMHTLWDGLLGKRFGSTATNRRAAEIMTERALVERGEAAVDGQDALNPQIWLEESRKAALAHVYTPEIIQAVSAAARVGAKEPETITLSEAYLKNAGRVAQVRAIEAGWRLAMVWEVGLL